MTLEIKNPDDCKVLRWCIRALAKDDVRQYPNYLHAENGQIIVTDGKRIHQIDSMLSIPDEVYSVAKNLKRRIVLDEDPIGFPIPDIVWVMTKAPASTVSIAKAERPMVLSPEATWQRVARIIIDAHDALEGKSFSFRPDWVYQMIELGFNEIRADVGRNPSLYMSADNRSARLMRFKL